MTTAFQSNAFQSDAFQILGGNTGAGINQYLSFVLDDISATINQGLEHSQALSINLDSISVTINQTSSASVTVSAPTAGRGGRKRKFVEINGQNVWFDSPDEIYAILEKVKERIPEIARRDAIKIKTVAQAKAVKPPTVQINFSNLYDFADIKRHIDKLNAKIEKNYRDLLIREAQRNAEDEEILIALLMD
jgi:hypothetical protein